MEAQQGGQEQRKLAKSDRLRLLEAHEKLTKELGALREALQQGSQVFVRIRGTGPGFVLPDTAQGIARKERELMEIESLLERDDE
ncbi:Hypothetical Protein FCC1311_110882 [Hondaea fermentalgiana]|uniref:Uncharacterized protein n=1 Tax=Hondaea fermentalgiana TaxID=2315210 RepID=A0A2R5GWB0_9STRA|nr:Hypothetical Protein FCC1311_110882 [Hondaea fermentalgiana]|eukprot:GBG34865.1 Hypothetical Protein FCC1311_110882 [Hondaea fermentalgiana]